MIANEPGHYADLGVRVVPDAVPDRGPLGALYTALLTASTSHVLVVARDLPFVTGPFLAHVAAAGRDAMARCRAPRKAGSRLLINVNTDDDYRSVSDPQ